MNNYHLKVSELIPGAKGRKKNRTVYKSVGGVIVMRFTEDEKEEPHQEVNPSM
jgi:hypothetical protein